MMLKEKYEILRGEPIGGFVGDSMDIPCIETSDSERLCKHPIVSVHMLAYNHEAYIRQAIEGVMMQKTDFEFELVIGEDCSQDKTREICFEYQKKYPDKIRVLWWHENVSKFGGNGRRTFARCRGEFIAFCEGDDYWIDPEKLSKQVDVFRRNPSVGLCFTDVKVFFQEDGRFKTDGKDTLFRPGFIDRCDFRNIYLCGEIKGRDLCVDKSLVRTQTTMYRAELLRKAKCDREIFHWRLFLGDVIQVLGISMVADVYYLPDITAVYRVNATGVTCGPNRWKVWRDAWLVRLYFSQEHGDRSIVDLLQRKIFRFRYQRVPWGKSLKMMREELDLLIAVPEFKSFAHERHLALERCVMGLPLPIWVIRFFLRLKRKIFS